jgi:fructosamine-3-kinase
MIFASSTKTLIVSITIALVSSSSSRAFVTTSRITFSKRANSNVSRKLMMSFLDTVSNAASEALGKDIQLVSTIGGGSSGGGGATTGAVLDTNTNTKYFIKSTTSASRNGHDMLRAEYEGVKAMSNTNTIRVPTPITFGTHIETNQSFVLFEYLEFCGGGSQYELGVALAKMHKDGLSSISPNSNNKDDSRGGGGGGKFGFHVNNTIGATFQPNLPWYDDWADFWDEHRLGHMLKLTNNAGGLSNEKINMLRQKTRELLSSTNRDGDPIIASIVHGDLWGGNKGFCKDNKDDDDDDDNNNNKVLPVIFDPAAYYGDREVDVAMTYLFGGFNDDFYEGYNSEWPLSTGHEKRRTIYNLYHILNHHVLFGGGYINQARSMIEQILRY